MELAGLEPVTSWVRSEHRHAIADALRGAGVGHELVEYPGAPHGFLCDRRDTSDPAASEDAWQRIQTLLREELRSPGPRP